jgi:hypothetical protein
MTTRVPARRPNLLQVASMLNQRLRFLQSMRPIKYKPLSEVSFGGEAREVAYYDNREDFERDHPSFAYTNLDVDHSRCRPNSNGLNEKTYIKDGIYKILKIRG